MLSSSISSVTCDSPGPRGGAAANDLVGKSDVEVREAIGNKFPFSGKSGIFTAFI